MNDESGIEALADKLYTHYCHAVGGKAYNDTDLPPWSEFGSDPAKKRSADGWRAIARLVHPKLDPREAPIPDFTELYAQTGE